MSIERLGYGEIHHLKGDIAEVFINEGVEMNDAIVDDYHRVLEKHYDGDFGLLVNKKNQYTYTFSAQQRVASLPNIRAVAIVVYRRSSEIATQALLDVHRESNWHAQTFYCRDEAIDWLKSQLSQHNRAVTIAGL